ncbi:hypothetical protein ABZT17_19115 [Streptomyces sp. NPDC005648]|uniref:hypothetical protein n=1 Tax=Streptomyces sp. NPDC005648 TaxID=3157044 RepID=UPI0033B874E4
MTDPHPRTARSGRDVRILRAAVFAAVCVVLAAGGHALASCATVAPWTLGAGFLAVFLVAAPLAGRERSLPGIAALLAAGQTVLHTLFGLGQHAAMAGGGRMPTTSTTSTASMASMSDASLVERAARLVCGTTAAAISPAHARKLLADARIYPANAMSRAMGMDMSAVHQAGSGTGIGTGTGAGSSASTASMAALLPSLPMFLGHVLAALAAGWLLRHGDRALLRSIQLSEGAFVRSLRAALALVCALRSGLPAVPEPGPRTPRTALLAPARPRTTALQHSVIRRGPPAGRFCLAA